MAAAEEHLSRLKGGYEHLATKADLYQLEDRMVRWLGGMAIGIGILAVSVAGLFFQTLLD